MSAKKRGLALLCAALVALALAFPAARAVKDSFIFLGLNDRVALPLSAHTMPIYANGTYYVAYSQFESGSTKENLGVSVVTQKNTVSVYTKQKVLTFDLASGTCLDKDGAALDLTPAILRNGVTYLPVSSVCGYFSDVLSYSALSTTYGTLIRLKSAYAILDDETFRSLAESSFLGQAVTAYLKSLDPAPTFSPPPGVSTPPTPTPTSSPGGSERPDRRGVRVYLGFRCEGGEAGALLDALDREGVAAAFFFRPEDLYRNDAVIRRMVGSGHVVGLRLPEGDVQTVLAALKEGQSALELITHTRTHITLAEGGEGSVLAALEEAGWTVWREDAVLPAGGSDTSAADALLKEASVLRDRVFLGLDDSARAAAALPRVLSGLREQRYSIRLAVETER